MEQNEIIVNRACFGDGWISVKNRLPKPEIKVLCVCEHYGVFNGVYTDSGECYEWFNNEEGVYIRSVPITHWMPLPNPPDGP